MQPVFKRATTVIAWLVPILLALGYLIGSKTFAVLGIPLPVSGGGSGVPHTAVKLYPFEIGLIILTCCAIARSIASKRFPGLEWVRSSPILQICLFLMGAGFLRALPDLAQGEWISVIRNSSFVWYLMFPVLLSLCLREADELMVLDRLVTLLLCSVASYFVYSVVRAYLIKHPLAIEWFPNLGIYFLIFWGIFSRRKYLPLVGSLFLGLGLGFALYGSIQRTTALGCVLSLAGAVALQRRHFKLPSRQFIFRWLTIVTAVPLGYGVWQLDLVPTSLTFRDRLAKSLEKAEAGRNGLERIRWAMWTDALNEFARRPITGIGFHEQVVKRIYIGGEQFAPNTGGFESPNSPPISGPHNSYLNALARIGIIGILFALLHGLAAVVLFRNGLYALACVGLGQAWYALFNVGLEGPIRSTLLLTSLGAAITAEQLQMRHSSIGRWFRAAPSKNGPFQTAP